MHLNHVSLMGNLTRDPEIRYLATGKAVCHLAMANNRVYIKDGEKVSEVHYFDVDVWGVAAENCSKYLAKGSGIAVEGRLRQDRWEKEGKTHSRVKITANAVHFLPKRQNLHPAGQAVSEEGAQEAPTAAVESPEEMAWEE